MNTNNFTENNPLPFKDVAFFFTNNAKFNQKTINSYGRKDITQN